MVGAAAQRPISLWIVDAQQMMRDCLARLFSQVQGLAVVATSSDLDALPTGQSHRAADVALLSVYSGQPIFERTAAFLATFPPPRVVMLSELFSSLVASRAQQLGVSGYVTKQEPFTALERAVRRVAAGGKFFPETDERHVPGKPSHPKPPTARDPFDELTPRELEVLRHIAQGYTVKQCAQALGISPSTADNHKSRLMRKLRIHKAVDLTRLALARGLVIENGANSHPWPSKAS